MVNRMNYQRPQKSLYELLRVSYNFNALDMIPCRAFSQAPSLKGT